MGSIRHDGKAGTGCSSSSNRQKSFDDQAARASYVDGTPNPVKAHLLAHSLKALKDLVLLEDLADATGAELVCSRPLAEGVDWVAKNRYVGISGQHIAPDFYFAVGISGQIQHMVGVRSAKVIVAVNSC